VARNAFATSSAVAASHVSLFPHAARRALWTGCGQPLEIGFNSLIRRGFAIIAKKNRQWHAPTGAKPASGPRDPSCRQGGRQWTGTGGERYTFSSLAPDNALLSRDPVDNFVNKPRTHPCKWLTRKEIGYIA